MNDRRHRLLVAALSAVATAILAGTLHAQTQAPSPPAAPQPAADAVAQPGAPAPVVHQVRIPEGTEVRVHFNEQLSSATAAAGDTFSITTDDPISLPDGTVLAA